MPAANAFVIGNNEVGHFVTDPSPADSPWGKTAQEGFTVQMNVNSVRLLSAQSKMAEDVATPEVGMQITINAIDGALQNVGRVFAMPDSDFTGDLSTGSDEELAFNQVSMGQQERALYAEGPGPLGSIRRFEAYRCKSVNFGPLVFGSTNWQLPTVTMEVLNPGSDPVAKFIDQAAS